MSKSPNAFDPLQQLASATAMDDELSEKLLQALLSPQAFPINLAWIVPLLQYKHISSLTTHLKRHFKKDLDYQKLTSGSRTHTYFISVECFRGICNYARHSERRTLAQYWLKVMGDTSVDTPITPTTLPTTPILKKEAVAPSEVVIGNHHPGDETDSNPSSPENSVTGDQLHRHLFHVPLSIPITSQAPPDIDPSNAPPSSTTITSTPVPSLTSIPDKEKAGEPLPITTMYHYTITSKPSMKRDFPRVNILSKKRKTDISVHSPLPNNINLNGIKANSPQTALLPTATPASTLSSPLTTPSIIPDSALTPVATTVQSTATQAAAPLLVPVLVTTSSPAQVQVFPAPTNTSSTPPIVNVPATTPTNWTPNDQALGEEPKENFGVKPNLKLLSELALGLR